MRRTASPKAKPKLARRPPSPERIARLRLIRRTLIHLSLILFLVGGIGWLVNFLKSTIAQPVAGVAAEPPRIVFANRPAWMTDLVAQNLAASFRPTTAPSVFDRDALVAIDRKLAADPWIAKVRQVRRAYGESAGDTIEVDCDFRSPMALVHDGDDGYWFVDAKGIKLPEKFSEAELPKLVYADGKVNLRVIEGVKRTAPKKAAQLWLGDDLAAGLEMAATLNGKPFADDIVTINVANYGGRVDMREAHLVLITRLHVTDPKGQATGGLTEVRWGRPLGAFDRKMTEVPPEQKFASMEKIVRRYGRVDANKPWIDVRWETITYPAVATNQDGGH